jgi:hypothetical protein
VGPAVRRRYAHATSLKQANESFGDRAPCPIPRDSLEKVEGPVEIDQIVSEVELKSAGGGIL